MDYGQFVRYNKYFYATQKILKQQQIGPLIYSSLYIYILIVLQNDIISIIIIKIKRKRITLFMLLR